MEDVNGSERVNRRPAYLASAAVLLLICAVSAYAWMRVPADARIPVHWGLHGEVDRYGGKFEAFLVMPLAAAFLTALFAVIPLFEPRKLNLRRSWKAYSAIWIATLALLFVIHVMLVLGALGYAIDMGRLVPILLGGLFIVMGNYMGKIRSNFFVGIRTPWTLSSELSWNKTHRIGGWLFVLWGLLMIGAGLFVQTPAFLIVMLAGVFVITAFLLVYSYRVWKQDPAKQSLGR
jgi:uncharacterized membrane protein